MRSEQDNRELLEAALMLKPSKELSRGQSELLSYVGYFNDFSCLAINQTCFNRLPNIDLMHQIIPSEIVRQFLQ